MLVKLLSTYSHPTKGSYRPGIVNIPDDDAQELITAGFALAIIHGSGVSGEPVHRVAETGPVLRGEGHAFGGQYLPPA